MEPYYVMWQLPGSERAEFVLILPFTPKNRQVLIGWIAAFSDGDNYGRFIAYKFPKERRVLGPQQVETKIDQDPFLSGQLTLWDQQGSEVIRGNVLAIPINDTLLYVEPIYLRAETAAYPELRLVAVMQGDNLSYAPTFDEALLDLVAGTRQLTTAATRSAEALAEDARRAFDDYLEALAERRRRCHLRDGRGLEHVHVERLEPLHLGAGLIAAGVLLTMFFWTGRLRYRAAVSGSPGRSPRASCAISRGP